MVREVISGVGKDAKRVDLNNSNLVSDRVKKLQREAKIQNASGGTYGQRTQLDNIASGASTEMPTSIVNPTAINTVMSGTPVSPLDQVYDGPDSITDGAPGNTSGRQPEDLPMPVDAIDNNALIARAMFMMDPTPQNRRLMESFQKAGR